MLLSMGDKLGPYEILSSIGAGGMGEVYRARDTKLGRDVALKVLREAFAQDADRMARFEREARLLASLNHPNIASVYGLQESDGIRALVMELVDGPTLAERIGGRALTFEDALPIAKQIAEALERAHEMGIVHRDLKPANVKLTADGNVKVLDFGLAKALEANGAAADNPSTVSTLTIEGTRAGVILGSAGYMAPEQARGNPVDKRADVWAFGVVLYEMLTGRRLFKGETVSDTLVAVLTHEPDWERVPERARHVLRLCLEKDHRRRLHDIGDAKRLLDMAPESTAPVASPRRALGWTLRKWLIAGAAAALCFLGASSYWIWSHTPYRPKPASLEWYDKGVRALRSTTYESARKALQQAVSNDPRFALAHASLAQAYEELDYTERAKESMLRAVATAAETKLSAPDERRLRSFQLVISHEYERAAPLLEEMEKAASPANKPAAALECGWLADRRGLRAEAVAAYERALKMDPSYAPAKLRLASILHSRRGDFDLALKTFQEAERLFDASSDYEGVTEAELGQVTVLIRSNRGAEALPLIEKARAIARPIGSSYLEIRMQLLQGTAYRSLGEFARSGEVARQAIEAADAEHMDNLASSALVDLGNSYVLRRDLAAAEPIFLRALSVARRSGVRRYESRALLALASICEQSSRSNDARQYIEASLPFYREGGYRREVLQATLMMGGILAQQAQYADSIRVLRGVLDDAARLHDVISEAQLHERIGEALWDQSDWPAALSETERAASLFGPDGRGFDVRLNSAQIRWKLGRREEAARSLTALEALLKRNPSPRNSFELTVLRSEFAYEDGRIQPAATLAKQALALPGVFAEARLKAVLLLSLAFIRKHQETEGLRMASAALDQLEQTHLELEAAHARLSLGEALADVGRYKEADIHARKALEFFEPHQITEAVWRGHLVAAMAARKDESNEHLKAARAALEKLKSTWPAEDFARYLERPSIRAAVGKL